MGWLRWAWRWSWLVTVPATAVFVLWLTTTFQRWHKFVVGYDARPIPVDLHQIGLDSWNTMLRTAMLRLRGANLADVPVPQQLRSVQLLVSEAELARLGQDLPYSGTEYVKALLAYPEGFREVKVRYRGDFLLHWGYEKKSIRIRTRNDDLFGGMREFNLIAPKFPEQVNNVLAYRLASRLKLITPHCEFVNVFVNGRNVGVHELTEQLDEGTLRRHDRMPGDLYVGEFVGRDQWRGASNLAFDLPHAWGKAAANNHYDLESRAPLAELLRLLREEQSEATHAGLSRLLDMDAWGRFGAFELLAQTHHFDEAHNWRLFWDPWRLKFEPVVWDPTGWTPDSRAADGSGVTADITTSRLQQVLLQNGDYLQARHRALQAFFTDGTMEQFLADADATLQRVGFAIAHDPNLRPTDERVVTGAMAALRPYLRQILDGVRAAHLDGSGSVQWSRVDPGTVRLRIEGRRPVTSLVLRFERPPGGLVSALLRTRRFGVAHDVDLGAAVTVRDTALELSIRLLCQLVPEFRFLPHQVLRQHGKRPSPAFYDLCLPGLDPGNRVVDVTVVRDGVIEGAEPVADLAPLDTEFLFRAVAPPRGRIPLSWRGEVPVEGVREILEDVTIAPGTLIELGPGASLVFRGRVVAMGTREQPIRFQPKAAGQKPWGTVALNGPDCTGSVFAWCRMRGGSGHQVPLEEYCSMFAVHNCENVRIEDCVFADNHQYDDLVHVVYSNVVFDRVELLGARADGLDCDISTVVIRNSRFVNCGNDAIDLMTARTLVHDCRFELIGDKGISIGEGSRVLALRSVFTNCDKALEAKDGSVAHVANCEIRRCRGATNAYRKNWRYDSGGRLVIHKSVVVDNGALATADRWSITDIVDCQTTGELAAEFDQEYVDGTSTRMKNMARLIDCDGGLAPSRREPLPFPEEMHRIGGRAAEAWASVRADVRGVPVDR